MAVDRQQKVLRVGVIQGGKIVEERVLPAQRSVTVGTSPRNTLVVPGASLPESTEVFSWESDRYTLLFAEGVEGRIQGPQGSADFGALVSQGLARTQGELHAVQVNDDQRGKIVLGDVTLLWQFVAAPAETPKPVLPKEAQGNHFRSLDRLFAVVLGVSFAVHTGAYVALANTELPKEVTLEEIPDRYAKLLIPERLPKPPAPPEEKKPEAVVEQKRAEEKKSEGEKRQESPEQVAAKKAARAAAVAKAVQSKGMLKVLGALGPGMGAGAVADVFGTGGTMGDVASALSDAGGVAVANDPGAAGGRKGAGKVEAASIGDLATSGGGKVAYGAKTEVRVSGTVAAEEAEVDSSDIDPQKLAAFVKARMGPIKSCYENALKRNPSLRGKVSIRFTILETGGLADIAAAQNGLGAPEVAACIVQTMRAWRTQFRPSGPVTVEYPFVFSPAS
jgi:outer membrane biosynthesis protein TonB